MQGPGTDQSELARLAESLRSNEACTIDALILYSKDNRAFRQAITATPLPSIGSRTSRLVKFTMNAAQPCDLSVGSTDAAEYPTEEELTSPRLASMDTTMSTFEEMAASTTSELPVGLDDCTLISYEHASRAAPCVVTSAEPPHTVLWANAAWLDLCDFDAADILGRTLSCIQGPATDPSLIQTLMTHVQAQTPCSISRLINYTKRRQLFCHNIHVEFVDGPKPGMPAVFCTTSCDIMRTDVRRHPKSIRRASGEAFATKPAKGTGEAAGAAAAAGVAAAAGAAAAAEEDEAAPQAHCTEAEEANTAAQLWSDDFEDYLESLDASFANLPDQGFAAQTILDEWRAHVTNPAALMSAWPLD